ncbi:MAG: UDP-N-acetylglucosamine 2-epimerase (hydrolyzing), partial [Candidatus Lokiarchaeota archaeon]|nr:UDP-N-acetylglucosamine 2-epimerase (hydrolyzing) [Candidatus Lokiarchaeota archaeon]
AYMNILIAHIHGGDVTRGGLDESARHAITKFSHIHFPVTQRSAERIIKLGEDPWRITVVGSPSIDTIKNIKLLTKKEIEARFKISLKQPLILMIQHSISTEPEKARSQILETIKALKRIKINTIIIYPNSDSGSRTIIRELKKIQNLPFIQLYKSLDHRVYLSLLKNANVLIGNSSSGIIESSFLKTPVVNIGHRQEGRERSLNVIDVECNSIKIENAIQKTLYEKSFLKRVAECNNPYGGGNASKLIVNKLVELKIDEKWFQKKITY